MRQIKINYPEPDLGATSLARNNWGKCGEQIFWCFLNFLNFLAILFCQLPFISTFIQNPFVDLP